MGGILFKVIAFFVVVGAIFSAGVIVGVSLTESTEETQISREVELEQQQQRLEQLKQRREGQ